MKRGSYTENQDAMKSQINIQVRNREQNGRALVRKDQAFLPHCENTVKYVKEQYCANHNIHLKKEQDDTGLMSGGVLWLMQSF